MKNDYGLEEYRSQEKVLMFWYNTLVKKTLSNVQNWMIRWKIMQ